MNEQSPLAQIFQENKDAKFVFVQPGGNYGDRLIYFGLEVLARKLKLNFQSFSTQEFLDRQPATDEILYMHGGGGFNRWCSGISLKILDHALHSKAKMVIQGPCTIEQDTEYVQNILAKVLRKPDKPLFYFMARELMTFKLCNEYLGDVGANISLDQDTAFWADSKSLEACSGPPRSMYRFYALREDNEVSSDRVHDYGKGITFDPAYFCKSFEHWIKVHLHAKEIITTRTHSAIVGALLNKPVIMYPSRYHKNRSIWEHSLKQRGVIWGPGEDRPYLRSQPSLRYLPAKVRNSYRVNQLVRWLQRVPLS